MNNGRQTVKLEQLNTCGLCKREIGNLGYFRLDKSTDRFGLECEDCHFLKENEIRELAQAKIDLS